MTRIKPLLTLTTLTAAVALLGLLTLPLHAANIFLVSDNGPGQSWEDGGTWSDGNPAEAGNDYFAEPTDDAPDGRVRNPEDNDNNTFPGDSLTIRNDGKLATKSTNTGGQDKTITFDDLIIDEGTIQISTDNVTHTIAGNMEILGGGVHFTGSSSSRNTVVDSLISGSGEIQSTMTGEGTLTLANSGNTWDGDLWVDRGTFDTTYELDLATSILTAGNDGDGGSNSFWDLGGFDHTFGLGSSVGGELLSQGTFDVTELNGFGNNGGTDGTEFSGTGTITVIPEPTSMVLMITALGGMLLLSRRRMS